MIKRLILISFLVGPLFGCAGTYVGDAFELTLPEHDAKWHPEKRWAMEDVHVYVNLFYDNESRKTPEFRNKTCLPVAELKYKMALSYGYSEDDLEIVVIKLSEDTALKLDKSKGWPTHAVLRYKDTIFDNGFISDMPFDMKYLSRYGEIIPDQWSKYRKIQ